MNPIKVSSYFQGFNDLPIKFYVGPMCAEKSKNLIETIDKARFLKQEFGVDVEVFIFKFVLLNVFEESLSSRALLGRTHQANPLTRLDELKAFYRENIVSKLNSSTKVLVVIDEVQFFESILEHDAFVAWLLKTVEEAHNVTFVLAGLNADFRRVPFCVSAALSNNPLVQVFNQYASCSVCGRLAGYTTKIASDEDVRFEADLLLYKPLCSVHHLPFDVA